MSTVERIEISCDIRGCSANVVVDADRAPLFAGLDWWITDAADLCPPHSLEPVPPAAPPAAPAAGTTSPEGITLTLSAHDAVWISTAMQHHAYTSGSAHYRELIRELDARIEDYARSHA